MRLHRDPTGHACAARVPGFSLLEVMIAIGIFFMVAFTVLALVSQCLRQARALELVRTPIGAIASDTMMKTPLEYGLFDGDFDEIYPDHRWEAKVAPPEEYSPDLWFVTNETLVAVQLLVRRSGPTQPDAELILLKFQPDPPPREQKGAFWE